MIEAATTTLSIATSTATTTSLFVLIEQHPVLVGLIQFITGLALGGGTVGTIWRIKYNINSSSKNKSVQKLKQGDNRGGGLQQASQLSAGRDGYGVLIGSAQAVYVGPRAADGSVPIEQEVVGKIPTTVSSVGTEKKHDFIIQCFKEKRERLKIDTVSFENELRDSHASLSRGDLQICAVRYSRAFRGAMLELGKSENYTRGSPDQELGVVKQCFLNMEPFINGTSKDVRELEAIIQTCETGIVALIHYL